MHTQHDEILTISDLSVYLKISWPTLYELAREGKIPSQKIGRHWRFRNQAIDRWMEEIPVHAATRTSEPRASLEAEGAE